ncbi:MAG: FG-GAP-like repeat-containing protein [Cyanophyceae cyanobacterium]
MSALSAEATAIYQSLMSNNSHNLTESAIERIGDAALDIWNELLNPQISLDIDYEIEDLPVGTLAEALVTIDGEGELNGGTIIVDDNANGTGWFVDPTPEERSEFGRLTSQSALATVNSEAYGRYDLLTTVLHEIGHLAGFIGGYAEFDQYVRNADSDPVFVGNDFTAPLTNDLSHIDAASVPNDLMNAALPPGTRQFPSPLNAQILNTTRARSSSLEASIPLAGLQISSSPVPAFADLDDDGDLDAVVGEINGELFYYRNENNSFVSITDDRNPFEEIDVGFVSTPHLVDFEGDGDADLFVGEFDGTIGFYRNNDEDGFVEKSGGNNPFSSVDTGSYSNITFANVDGDGDIDAFLGLADGTVAYYRNENGRFVPRRGTFNPLNGVDVGYFSVPAFGDVDGDGDEDALIGEVFGRTRYYRNNGGTFTEVISGNPFRSVDVGFYAAPSFADVDGDGDEDAIVGGDFTLDGDERGRLSFIENSGRSSLQAESWTGSESLLESAIAPVSAASSDVV